MSTHITTAPAALQNRIEALPVDAARVLACRWAKPIIESECVSLPDALGRVLAQNITAPFNVPIQDHAAMDGYAFNGDQLASDNVNRAELEYAIVGTVLAGHPFTGTVLPGTCVRIMTGAPLPAGCDTVIPHEHVIIEPASIRFARHTITRGQHCRRAGEDLARGTVVLCASRIVQVMDLGLLASFGIAEISVRRKARVAFFSTGDELHAPDETLGASGIYDSNRALLYGMLKRLNVDLLDLGIIRDDPAALESILCQAAATADVIITSGGISSGDADFLKALLSKLGDVAFASLAMRPGRPLACGQIRASSSNLRPALFFGLPGNPAAVVATFCFIARDALLTVMGAEPQPLPLYPAISTHTLKKRVGRTEYLRGSGAREADGTWRVTLSGSQSAASLSGLSAANCFIVLGPELSQIDAGATVDILPFNSLL